MGMTCCKHLPWLLDIIHYHADCKNEQVSVVKQHPARTNNRSQADVSLHTPAALSVFVFTIPKYNRSPLTVQCITRLPPHARGWKTHHRPNRVPRYPRSSRRLEDEGTNKGTVPAVTRVSPSGQDGRDRIRRLVLKTERSARRLPTGSVTSEHYCRNADVTCTRNTTN